MIEITIPEVDGSICLENREYIENKNKTKSIKALMDMPNGPGVYLLYDKEGTLLYVGKAGLIRSRIKQHLDVKPDILYGYGHNVYRADYLLVTSATERDIYQTYMINTLNPILNIENLDVQVTNKYKDLKVLAEEQEQDEKSFQLLKKIMEKNTL